MKPDTHPSSRLPRAPVGSPADTTIAHRRRLDEKPSDAFDPNHAGGFSHTLKTLPLTFVLTVAVGLGLATLAAAIAYISPDPSAVALPLSYAALLLTALVGGILSGRRCGADCAMGGFLSGVLLVACLSLVSLLAGNPSGVTPLLAWGVRIGMIPLHLLGAYLVRPRERQAAHTAGKHTSQRH